MSAPYRLGKGGRIDRSKPLDFVFDAKPYRGYAGDTLASALLAHGVHFMARSFKYHRPRGPISAGSEEPNALVQLGRGATSEPNMRATEIELHDGLVADPQNVFPSLGFDFMAWQGLVSDFFPAGFYYKTFLWPRRFWTRVYEPIIRRAAGLGKAPDAADPSRYDKMNWHCDVLVVGAGPAGLACALQAASGGARVVIADQLPEFGGSLLDRTATVDGGDGAAWADGVAAELRAMPEVLCLTRTTVFAHGDHNHMMALERRTDHLGPHAAPGAARQRLWHIRARRVILATGAHDRPLVFPGNDRPGILLASAGSAYARRYAVTVGRKIVGFVNNDDAYGALFDLHEASGCLAQIVDPRREIPAMLADRAKALGIRVAAGAVIAGTSGATRVSGALIADRDGNTTKLACDAVLMSGGRAPVAHLLSQAGGSLRYDDRLACFVPDRLPKAVDVAGAANGRFALADAISEGLGAGRAAAEAVGHPAPARVALAVDGQAPTGGIMALWSVKRWLDGRAKGKAFIDFQNDVAESDIDLASREGFRSVEHLKRYTTTGMATDQGKTSNVNALALLADATNRAIPEVGTTTFRPPYTPVAFGALAGRDVAHSDPMRTTPIHARHVALGAVFENVGQWKRPHYYPQPGEDMDRAVARECSAVREAVGILDASTLGKIDIQGPDAAQFLNLVYTNAWTKLAVGSCRYGLMCRADGMVFDDGVTSRLAPNHFLMTTTTGNAARVLDWLEEWLQTEWPHLKVHCTSVTEQYATIAVAGPKARSVLEQLSSDIDFAASAFPFMTFRDGQVAGVAARVFRISFTGELSYEIMVPSWFAPHVWERVMAAGAAFGITPYGTETMHVLRAEKGFVIIGQETDGTVTPQDLGMDWIVAKSKDFIGKRSQARPDLLRPDRRQLVALIPADPQVKVREGTQLIGHPDLLAVADREVRKVVSGAPPMPIPSPRRSLGYVTASYWSPALKTHFALAMIEGGRDRLGQQIFAVHHGTSVAMTISDPVLYDREGTRRDG